jgi:hypothetical protein
MTRALLNSSEGQWVSLHTCFREEGSFCLLVALLLMCFMLSIIWSVRTKWNICNIFISGGLCLSVDIYFPSVCNGL